MSIYIHKTNTETWPHWTWSAPVARTGCRDERFAIQGTPLADAKYRGRSVENLSILGYVVISPAHVHVRTSKRFLQYWSFVRGIHLSPVDSTQKVNRGFDVSLLLAWTLMSKLMNKQSRFQHYVNYWIRVDITASKMQVFGILAIYLIQLFANILHVIYHTKYFIFSPN